MVDGRGNIFQGAGETDVAANFPFAAHGDGDVKHVPPQGAAVADRGAQPPDPRFLDLGAVEVIVPLLVLPGGIGQDPPGGVDDGDPCLSAGGQIRCFLYQLFQRQEHHDPSLADHPFPYVLGDRFPDLRGEEEFHDRHDQDHEDQVGSKYFIEQTTSHGGISP